MKSKKKRSRRSISTKMLVLMMAMVLLLGCGIGGTLAYLTVKTDPITNTFTAGNIDIDLTETFNTDGDHDNVNDSWVGKMVPGNTLDKDPKVIVTGGSEACWLFVKVDKEGDFDSYITATIVDDWKVVPGETNVYYQEVASSNSNQEFPILVEDEVTVKQDVTKDKLDVVTNGTVTPKLTFTAYAVQKDNVADAATAWAEAELLGN